MLMPTIIMAVDESPQIQKLPIIEKSHLHLHEHTEKPQSDEAETERSSVSNKDFSRFEVSQSDVVAYKLQRVGIFFVSINNN